MLLLYLLGTLLMIALPLLLASRLAHWREAGWGLFGIGAATFVASQIGHIPFNLLLDRSGFLPTDLSAMGNLLLVSLMLGLSAGIFEEVARYLAYRFWATGARTWRAGLMLGAGHGGLEAILLGILGLVNVVAIFGIGRGHFQGLVPAEQLPLVQAQMEALQAAAWYDALLGPAERAFALAAHLAMSLLVLQTFLRQQLRWLWLAIAWHTLLDALAVFTVVRWNAYVAEGALALVTLGSIATIFWLRPAPAAPAPAVVPPPAPEGSIQPRELPLDRERLEQSRFQ